jgi:hypothetical protein
VPRVLATGWEGRYRWAVSERVPGRTLLDLPRAEVQALVPELVALLANHESRPAAN